MDRLSTKGQMIDQIDLRAVPHSGFDRSNHNYFTGKMGAIIPTRLDEVYPGDRIKGRPEMVANFEPLAAPLMGSMVLKQESFFIPLPQVWRHSYKFFTGKNGFSELIPSVTPKYIYDIYSNYFLYDMIYSVGTDNGGTGFDYIVRNLNLYFDTMNQDKYSYVSQGTFLQDMDHISSQFYTLLYGVYNPRKMLDLVLPLWREFDKFAKSDYIKELSSKFEEDTKPSNLNSLMQDLARNLGDWMMRIHQFFFGPSSLFDYLGWQITLPDNFKEVAWGDIFTEAVWRNIVLYESVDNLEERVGNIFSQVPLNFLPFKGYYLTWYWNYRDQLLETDILDPDEDEFLNSEITDNVILYCTLMRQRCWFKDAYTTALTNTGDGNLLVPTGFDNDADITTSYYDNDGQLINTTDRTQALKSGATVCKVQNGSYSYKIPMNYLQGAISRDGDSPAGIGTFDGSYISLDLFDRIQRLRSVVQKRLILGYEVDDVIWSSFMVKLSNVRMHIPELLGRGRDAVEISTVVNNTSTELQVAGDKTAVAWTKGSISEIDYFAEEWGFYLQFCTIMPIQSYAGGMQRLYIKRDPLDYMWPEYSTMGMDAVYNFELGAFGTRLSDENGLKVFGYQGRYYDLKYRQDEEHGRLLTDLNYLTFSREFDDDNLPKLNYMFVHCFPRLDGFVVESALEDIFRADCYTAQGWERRLPVPSQFVH